MAVDVEGNEGPKAEIGLKAAEAASRDFEVRPGAFSTVVVRAFEEAVIDLMELVDVEVEVSQSRAIGPEAVGDSGDGLESGRGEEGDVEGRASEFGRAFRGNEPGLFGIEAGVFGHPEPSFFAADEEDGFVCKGTAAARDFREREGAEVFVDGQCRFMSPAGDGVVRDRDAEELGHDGRDDSGRERLEGGEVESQGDGRIGEGHFGVMEFWDEICLDAIERVISDTEGFAREGDVDFMTTMAVVFMDMVITAKSVAIGDGLEDRQAAAAFRAGQGGEFSGVFWPTGNELPVAGGVFTAESLQVGLT